jgi:hypothetical protein
MAGFEELDVHPDVPDGMRSLRASGIRLVTLSYGSTDVADKLLRRADLRADRGTSTARRAPGSARRGSTEPMADTRTSSTHQS